MQKDLPFDKVLGPVAAPEALWEQWQEELCLRQSLRRVPKAELYALPLENPEAFWFYKRTFYDVGEKEKFFAVVMNHFSQLLWSDILSSQAPAMIDDFFAALQQHFSSHLPNIEELKSLVSLFSPAYQDYYPALLAHLTEKDVKFLLDKTSNFALRSLLLQALETVQREESWFNQLFAMSDQEKEGLVRTAIQNLEQATKRPFLGEFFLPDCLKSFLIAGKIEEIIQIGVYLRSFSSSQALFEPAKPFFLAMIPLFALVKHPENAYMYAWQQYKKIFPEEKDMPSSFYYLHLYQLAAHHQTLPRLPFRREIALRIQQIMRRRPDDVLGKWFGTGFPEVIEETLAEQILDEAKKRLENAPHETWTLLEILYSSIREEKTVYSPQFLGNLLAYAWALYEWLRKPSLLPSLELLPMFSCLEGTALFAQIKATLLPKKLEELV